MFVSRRGQKSWPAEATSAHDVPIALGRHGEGGQVGYNITDWAHQQFTTHYANEIGKGKSARKISKEAIFHYCYAVLQDPLYRENYAQKTSSASSPVFRCTKTFGNGPHGARR